MTNVDLLEEIEQAAKTKLGRIEWDYLEGAAGSETTARENVEAFDSVKLLPRALMGDILPSITAEILGRRYNAPLLIAPTSPQIMFNVEAERATALAAKESGVGFIYSTDSFFTVEEIGKTINEPFWFQLYCYKNLEFGLELIEKAKAAGASAIVITTDATYPGRRERMIRAQHRLPDVVRFGNLAGLELDSSARRKDGSPRAHSAYMD